MQRIGVGDEVTVVGHAGKQSNYGREIRVEQISARGQTIMEVGPVDVCGLVESRAVFFKDVAGNASVVITTKSPSEPIIIQGDENRLSQVVDNVIQNAIDAMPDGGQLTINCDSVRRDNKSLCVVWRS